ncbi:MAG: TAXI family TRAP transporter solute-binding subunit [Herminiimonas sp.]|nr:TAXI family TRAP transporter solute-binding subunit [Herminiimonas sp.]
MPKISQPLPLRRTQRQALQGKRLRWLTVAGLLLLIASIWLLSLALQTPKRKTIVITAGAEGGIYMTFARRYADALANDGIALDIRPSSGAVENYQRLKDATSPYEIGLVQSGTGNAKDAPNLQTLASVSFEPIWIFYRNDQPIDRLSQLAGKRISVGQPGSGLRTVMLSLLAMHGIGANAAYIEELAATTASQALQNGQLDAAAFIGAPDIPVIDALLKSDLRLLNLAQADAIVRRFPSLSKVTFPRGAIDLARDKPPQDVTLLSTTALLVAKKTLHTETSYQLLDAVNEVHGMPSFFADRGEFPNQKIEDFPISDETRRYFRSGRPFLQNYLPFWLANFIEQRFVILLPSIAVFFALVQLVPRLYAYRMRSRLARWYHEIKLLEDEIVAFGTADPRQQLRWLQELDDIHDAVAHLSIPEAFIRDVYALKHAIHLVHDRIAASLPIAPVPAAAQERSGII